MKSNIFGLFLILLIGIVISITACGGKNSPTSSNNNNSNPPVATPTTQPSVSSYSVYYTVSSTVCSTANISYQSPSGTIGAGVISLPWTSSTYSFTSSQYVGVLGQNYCSTTGSITVNIFLNGSNAQSNTAAGSYATAQTGGILP